MLALVSLLNGFAKPLTYKIPTQYTHINVGDLVIVPLKQQKLGAIVQEIIVDSSSENYSFVIKEIIEPITLPSDPNFHSFIQKIANFYLINSIKLYEKLSFFIENKEPKSNHSKSEITKKTQQTILTTEQKKVIDFALPQLNNNTYCPILLHGVTGSGKTEIYKTLIEKCIANNKSVFLLLPEIALSLQFETRLKQTLTSNISIIGLHAASTPDEKYELKTKLLANKPVVVLGVHLPIFLPCNNLGLIIIDEEHEQGYTEKNAPYINSKQVALLRAQLYKIPILLGSATPSVSSLYNVEQKKWHFFSLKERYKGAFPSIQTVFLTQEYNRKKTSFWISYALEKAIQDRLAKKEQIIIYLNRRGFSFFVQCKQCGHVFSCPNCSVSLTAHTNKQKTKKNSPQIKQQSLVPADEELLLRCHYCDYSKKVPHACSTCKAPESDFLKKGIGTQQAVNILKQIFPSARIEKADADATRKKTTWKQTITDFEAGNLDILVGTKTITKGYHFPRVTLIGILWADLDLHMPQFDASEQTLQQLIQVAGRAGRECLNSTVIVQSLQTHPIFEFLNEEKYLDFAHYEATFRQETGYPPFGRLFTLELRNTNTKTITTEALLLCHALTEICKQENMEVTILGPALPPIHRIQKTEIRHIYLKSISYNNLHYLGKIAQKLNLKSSLSITPR